MKMKAAFIRKHGGAEVLEAGERPVPAPGAGNVLVRVKAAGLNHLDIWVRNGMPGLSLAFPHILGGDAAGIVAEVGAGVGGIKTGDRVMAASGVSCGRCDACLVGNDHLCPSYDILGQRRDGAYAEFVTVPAVNLFPIHKDLDFVEAASLPLAAITSWNVLVHRARVQPGETVLIWGGSGGVGVLALQLANVWGARTIVTVGDAAKAAKARKLGADHVIVRTRRDVVEEVMAVTEGRGADVVLDHVGSATFPSSMAALAKGGRLVVFGTTAGGDVSFHLRALFAKNASVIGARMGPRRGLADVLRFIETKQIAPVVAKTFPLSKAAEAHRLMESGRFFGKIVLKI